MIKKLFKKNKNKKNRLYEEFDRKSKQNSKFELKI